MRIYSDNSKSIEWHREYDAVRTTLEYNQVALASGSCNEFVTAMLNKQCIEIIRSWYGLECRTPRDPD